MRIQPITAILALLLLLAPAGSLAQQSRSSELTPQQREGRLLFQQRCPICHSSVMITHRPYAPILDRSVVQGNEALVRQTIMNGRPGRMPGFKYGMTPAEIDSIIAYLLTVERAPERDFGRSAGTAAAAPAPTGDQ